MIISQQILNKFSEDESQYKLIKNKLDDTLFNFCSFKGFAYLSRVKTVESLAEKLESGRFKNWNEIDDIIAATIIIPNSNYEEDVIEFLLNTFNEILLKKRGGSLKSPELFRFDSTRFIGKLKRIIGNEKERKFDISFEIQVKTALEHAWAVATHSISYKSNTVDWEMLRLTSQLKASVEQLDMIISGYEEVSKFIVPSNWPDIEFKKEIKILLDSKISKSQIPKELIPKDISRFCENILSLVKKLPYFKRKKMDQIIAEVKKTIADELGSYNDKTFPRSISLFQLILVIFNDKFDLNTIKSNYYPLITSEMETFYPKLIKVKNKINI